MMWWVSREVLFQEMVLSDSWKTLTMTVLYSIQMKAFETFWESVSTWRKIDTLDKINSEDLFNRKIRLNSGSHFIISKYPVIEQIQNKPTHEYSYTKPKGNYQSFSNVSHCHLVITNWVWQEIWCQAFQWKDKILINPLFGSPRVLVIPRAIFIEHWHWE